MISTGNDIVALDDALVAKAATPRFYSKILSVEELSLYSLVAEPAISMGEFVWLSWSVKESVYKFVKRLHPSQIFSPPKIILKDLLRPVPEDISYWSGMVQFKDLTIFARTYFRANFLHTIVSCNHSFAGLYWDVASIQSVDYIRQSAGCRKLLHNKIKEIYPGKKHKIEKTNGGVPYLLEEISGDRFAISFSHDGHYISYSLNAAVLKDRIMFPGT